MYCYPSKRNIFEIYSLLFISGNLKGDSQQMTVFDMSSGAILYKWWYIWLIAVAIAVLAIGVTLFLLPTTSPVHETQGELPPALYSCDTLCFL